MEDLRREIGWLLSEKYLGIETEAFKKDRARLESGEPLSYLIGHMSFLDATIHLDSHPLIPRAETEFWVGQAIREMHTAEIGHPIVLDLCAGSGCIGVAILVAIPGSTVHFEEIDTIHHKTIQKNVLENDIDLSRTEIFGGSLFAEIKETYHFILANPPYIDPEHDRTDESVRRYEPHRALYAADHGLAYISEIIEKGSAYLRPGGVLYVEHEPEHVDAICELASKNGYIFDTRKDQYGLYRYTRLSSQAS